MTKLKFIAHSFIIALFLQSCSKIIEPVSLFVSKQEVAKASGQEEFKINIKSLTFNTAKKANTSPYPRRLLLTGNGAKANVSNEAFILKSNFPKSSSSPNYLVGIGDTLSFTHLKEFENKIVQWPSISEESEYLLGVGDEMILTQSNDNNQNITVTMGENGQIIPTQQEKSELILTKGIIGSNGNILLFGLGNIAAANRTLDNVRTEVRNILIRNGLTPNFQLEISKFQSKKVYVTVEEAKSKKFPLNNLPITLKQIALEANLSESDENFALLQLTRNKQEFRFTAGQLFDLTTPEITLQDNDQIQIQIATKITKTIESVVGSKGNILLEEVGTISAVNRALDDIHEEISNILIEKGIKPSFQLELTKFASKKAYIIEKNKGNIVVPLTNSEITLRELILENTASKILTTGLSIITLRRNGKEYRMTVAQVLDPKTQNIWIIDDDQIEIENLIYKPGQVFALSGAGNAHVVAINPSKRESLSDILFTNDGILNNLSAKRSEVYLLRGTNPSIAYHLDAQNVSRILVAAKMELRPNDIVYVADRPIVSFSRTLAEILPLRILLRDIQNNNIP
jgi:protein involved in polysaccharide export with SLBB domain